MLERMMKMEVAKISSKGQITIPISVRNKLNLKTGDKVVIFEENGRFYFENSAMLAFKRAEQAFEGVAEKAGFQTEEEMQDYVKEIRKEMGRY
jgi:AbrB family looped-hinge helix DNA binding protein